MKTLKFKLIASAFASFVIAANPAFGQNPVHPISVIAEEPFTVKYLGNDGAYLLFEVVIRSADQRTVSLGISDKTEGDLYASNFRAGYKAQTIKIEKRNNQELDFRLDLGKNKYTKSFNVKNSVVENTVVSENDITRL